jgi:hypothetical protein
MKFEDLYKKIRAIDEGIEVAPVEAEGIEIIGGPMGSMLGGMGHSEPPKQQDSVSMNVSLNGAGAGGVRDLMDILHRIDAGGDHNDNHDDQPVHHKPNHEEPIMGDMIDAMASEGMDNNVEEFFRKVANSDDGSDMLYDAQMGKYGRELEQAVQDKYDDISIDSGLHGDDDFEQIYDRMMDNIVADYGNSDTDNQELGELTAEYPGGSTNFSTGEVKGTYTPEKEVEEEMGDDGETWANSSHGDAGAHTHGVDAVTATGDDMNSKGGSSPLSRAPGSNSLIRHHWHVQEGLVDKLAAMYEEIKGEPMVEGAFKDKDTDRKERAYAAKQTLKHIKNPTKGEKDAAKDIKSGSYKDRADVLASAEADGRLDESVSQMLALNKRLNG